MYKNITKQLGIPPGYIYKILLIMRLTTVLLIATIMQVSAGSFAQKISLNEKNAPLEKIFDKIRLQSGYDFLFNRELLKTAKPVDINIKNADIEDALAICFKGQPFTYTLEEKTIVIKEKTPSFLERVVDHWAAIDVHGRVVDQEGKPLPGATVKVKGTGKSVSTNGKGEFYLEKVEEGVVLVISFIGYVSREVSATKEMENMVLEISDSKLDEVQIMAYGETTRRLSTGNISTIKSEDIEKQPINNPLLALQGRVPGLIVTQSAGLPGSGISLKIQGQNSIGKGNDPLYVIDGIPYFSQLLSTNDSELLGKSGDTYGSQNGNPLSFINSNDIESIDILKDADATAIYGSRASSGAVLITTKKGREGKTNLNVNAQTGFGNVTRRRDLLNTKEYIEIRKEAYKNAGVSSIPTTAFDLLDGPWGDINKYTDWQKEFIGKTSNLYNIQASISGGNQLTQFLVSGNLRKETTAFLGDFGNKSNSVRFNISNKSLSQRFQINFSGNYSNDNNKLPGSDISNSIMLPPNAPPLFNFDGSVNWAYNSAGSVTFNNPIAVYLNQPRNIVTKNLVGNMTLSYDLFDGISMLANLGYGNNLQNGLLKVQIGSYLPQDRPTSQRISAYVDNKIETWTVEPQLKYFKRISGGNLDFLLGSTFQKNSNDGQRIIASGFDSDLIMNEPGAATSILVGNVDRSIYKYNALFTRLNYNWNERYILNISARRDGSSRFGSENLFHNFWSVGTAWILTNEDVIKKRLQFLSFLKIKSSYGTTGNDQIGNYTYLDVYHNQPLFKYPYQGLRGLETTSLSNPYIQWEETRKLNLGIDVGFIKDRILLSTNYYQNRSSNQILGYDLSMLSGFETVTSNFPATVQNYGIEFSLNTVNLKSDKFRWDTFLNLTLPRNKLISFPNLDKSSYFSSALIVGKPITMIKAYHFLGVNPETGLYEVADQNGKPTSEPNPLTDKTVYIDIATSFNGGLQNKLSYKNFEIDFLIQFVKQNAKSGIFGLNIPGQRVNQAVNILQRWQNPGDVSTIQKVSLGSDVIIPWSAANASDKAYEDASFIRLKNFSLSWNPPNNWKRVIFLQNCKVFLSGQNLITLTRFSGLDPENRSINSLPLLRVVALGLNISL